MALSWASSLSHPLGPAHALTSPQRHSLRPCLTPGPGLMDAICLPAALCLSRPTRAQGGWVKSLASEAGLSLPSGTLGILFCYLPIPSAVRAARRPRGHCCTVG